MNSKRWREDECPRELQYNNTNTLPEDFLYDNESSSESDIEMAQYQSMI